MRQWIYQALCAIVLDGQYSNLYIRKHLNELDQKDQALATRIVYGTLQNLLFCEALWQPYVKRVQPKLGVLLSMSAYQLYFLDAVPAYAVIDEAVNIARKTAPKSAGFINAVLRKVDRREFRMPDDPIEALSLKSSVPLWLIRLWTAQYGAKKAEQCTMATTAILPVYVRRNPLRISKAAFENAPHIQRIGDDWIYIGHDLASDLLYQEGKLTVQETGSYQISQFVGPKAGDRILDACAAPGTKTTAMAECMNDQGWIDALDLHAHRVKLIQKDCRRLHLACIHPRVMDACAIDDLGLYDRILCDVPCTGFGVMARKPDIKCRLKPENIDEILPVQKAILSSCSQHLKAGGTLVYSTCTINKKENERQIESFLDAHPDFRLEAMQTLFPDQQHDGFFMARLKRVASK
ncbi:16S rRNA (cytosine(967)-C(5))-methyltransferase RsmB [Catenisphaera adipataccumulans]|uniref:16S rRNA (cytosine(967)-C(5))-methyltransferase n=1 Tax=Catenisphaera adipataccumulans TaxID=700500 RepID=A0A7W8D0D4_9FIRM|nr:16S rRNA (cytosine(967)-C(5))-methyltransferase RsmB [Catenisphaera adipataccumulans]MBB5183679.1 16S rRNA (cytosine967-C5)-methyltransferase [Catenisphaera adipataccumulans]